MHKGHPDAIKLAAEAEVDPRTAAKFLQGGSIRTHRVRQRLKQAATKLVLKREPPAHWQGKRCEVCGAQAYVQVIDTVTTTEPGAMFSKTERDGAPHLFCEAHQREPISRAAG
jgi:hypothetical protein